MDLGENCSRKFSQQTTPSRHSEAGAAEQATKTRRLVAVCITCVLTTSVIGAFVIGSVLIVQRGTCAAEDCSAGLSETRASNNIMDTDSSMEVMKITEDGRMMMETMQYMAESNTVLIESPGNFSGSSPATFAVDFDRDVVFVSIHDDNSCVGFALRQTFATSIKAYLRGDNSEVTVISSQVQTETYVHAGNIPSGYLQSSNGPVTSGLCSGRDADWLEFDVEGTRRLGQRSCFNMKLCALKMCGSFTKCG